MEYSNLLNSLAQLQTAINNVSLDLKPEIEKVKSELTKTQFSELKQKQTELNDLLQQANNLMK
jgi:hypothetical protein